MRHFQSLSDLHVCEDVQRQASGLGNLFDGQKVIAVDCVVSFGRDDVESRIDLFSKTMISSMG